MAVPGVPRRVPYGPEASRASRARLRMPRPTVIRSTATPAAAPAATTPMAAPAAIRASTSSTRRSLRRSGPTPAILPAPGRGRRSIPRTGRVGAGSGVPVRLPVDVDARDPAADPGDDLVADRAGRPRP